MSDEFEYHGYILKSIEPGEDGGMTFAVLLPDQTPMPWLDPIARRFEDNERRVQVTPANAMELMRADCAGYPVKLCRSGDQWSVRPDR